MVNSTAIAKEKREQPPEMLKKLNRPHPHARKFGVNVSQDLEQMQTSVCGTQSADSAFAKT